MQFKEYFKYYLKKDDYIDKAFTQLPNGFINKGRCGIGGTSKEINDKSRPSILAVPNLSIIHDKCTVESGIFPVHGDITKEAVKAQLEKNIPAQKIMTTPEGIWKIIWAATELGGLEELFSRWYLLLDECHTYVTELFREDILKPFDYFWNFDNKAIISATPYFFSHPAFQKLDYHEILITEKLAKATVVDSISVGGTLNFMLTNFDKLAGNLHVFLNSVTEIRKAVIQSGLKDCNIYCADDNKKKNMQTLGELAKHFVAQPKTGEFKKVNFYTCRYFEGWDLFDENANLILVTDIYRPNTTIGIQHKAKQIFGRGRQIPGLIEQLPYKFIHITNHKHIREFKPLPHFIHASLKDAEFLIKQNEEYIFHCQLTGGKLKKDLRLLQFADIKEETQLATLNHMKLDQQINEAFSNEIYNHIDYIQNTWDKNGFDVDYKKSDILLQGTTVIKRKSKSVQLKDDYERLEQFGFKKADGTAFYLAETPEDEIKRSNPLAYQAFQLIDKQVMESLKYNVKKVAEAVILKENQSVEIKLLKLLAQSFQTHSRYSIETIKTTLQRLYNQLHIKDKNGKIRIATAKQLGERGRFDIKACKIANNKGDYEHGFLIVRPQFELRLTA